VKINTDPKKVDEVLSRGVEDVIVKEHLRKEMLSGKELKIYLGTDPTGGELHLGHAVIHKKLRDFQELGHKVTLLVGDFTVLVGDHSDKDDQRIELVKSQIEENMKEYKEQFGKTVDLSKVNLVYNSSWLKKLDFNDVIDLAKIFTLSQMVERDAIQKRLKEEKPVGFDELLYPLMQGFDALELKTDIQIGGSDQLFNMQAGRKIMEHYGVKPQDIITVKLLIGNDGRKMGKSLKNYIPIRSSAFDMYSGLMTIVDEAIIEYFTLLTRVLQEEISEMVKAMGEGSVNPKDLKSKLAFEVTKSFNGEKEAREAEEKFKKVVSKGEVPEDITEIELGDVGKPDSKGKIHLTTLEILVASKLNQSRSEARRMIQQGGFEINGEKITDPNQIVELKKDDVIRSGKRGFVKII